MIFELFFLNIFLSKGEGESVEQKDLVRHLLYSGGKDTDGKCVIVTNTFHHFQTEIQHLSIYKKRI